MTEDLTARTPEVWLPILTKRMDDNAARLTELRSWTNGTSKLPELNAKNQPSWTKFQEKSRNGYGLICINALGQRIKVSAPRVGASVPIDDSAKNVAKKFQPIATRIWKDNRFKVQVNGAIFDALNTGAGYLLRGLDDITKQSVITREKPEFMFASVDPIKPWIARSAIKVWRDLDLAQDFAWVWIDGFRQQFSRPMETDKNIRFKKYAGGWVAVAPPEPSSDRVPVYVLENKDGYGEFEFHMSLLERIQLGELNIMVIEQYQSFRQRLLSGKLPKFEADGVTVIDYTAMWEANPGSVIGLPEGVDIKELSSVDVTPLVTANRENVKEFAAVTQTQLSAMLPDSANQSAQGSLDARDGSILKAQERIDLFSAPLNVLIADAIRAEDPSFTEHVEIVWAPPALATLSDQSNADVQQKASGVPFRTRQMNIYGATPEEVDEMEAQLAQEQLALSAAFTPMSLADDGTPSLMPVDELKSRTDALGALIRMGVDPVSAGSVAGVPNVQFIPGLSPVTLKSNEPAPEVATQP